MDNLLILEDDKNNKVFSKEIAYDEHTTIQNAINQYFPGYEDIIVFDREKNRPCLKLDFYFHEGVIVWNQWTLNVLIVDYLNTFPNCREKGIILKNPIAGGIGGAPLLDFLEWMFQTANEFYKNHPVETTLCLKGIKLACSWAKRKIEDRISKYALEKAIHSKKEWTLSQAYKAFDVEDLSTLLIIMDAAGYEYDEENRLFKRKYR